MTGEFQDGPAKITGRVTLQSEDLDVILWRLRSDNGESFIIREIFSEGESEDDDEITYDILSDLDPNDTRSFEEAANEIFNDWKFFDDIQIEKDLETVASEGKGFNYRLYHKDSNNDCELDYPWDNSWPYPNGNLCVSATIARNGSKRGDSIIANQLTGYRIYRDGQLIKEIPYSFVTYFTDTEFTKETDVEYCITAVYGEEESEPVCATATITGITEKPENDGITVSPNPTDGLVRIGGVEVAEVQVYNAIGQLVKFAQNSNEINLRDLPQGVYSLRITGDKGEITSKKIVVE